MDVNSASSATFSQRQSYYLTSSIADFVHTDAGGGETDRQYSAPHRSKTGRKTWKSLKEKKEAVWPDYLEEALLEALEKYRPTSSKDPRLLRRFPKRNAFISEYIRKKTGKARTPKQVGSRLQQLRETCTEERVIRLICSRDFDAPDRVASAKASNSSRTIPDLRINTAAATATVLVESSSSSPSSGTASGLTPPSSSFESLTLVDPYEYPIPITPSYSEELEPSPSRGGPWPQAYVHLDLVCSDTHYSSASTPGRPTSDPSFTLDLDEAGLTDSPALTSPDAWKWQRRVSVSTALPACYHVPCVTLSSSLLAPDRRYESVFRVVQKGHGDKILFEESSLLERVSSSSEPPPQNRPSLFRTGLLPKYWGTVSNKISDLRQYAVIQDIYETSSAGAGAGAGAADFSRGGAKDPVYTVIYSFDCAFPFDADEVEVESMSVYFTPPTYQTAAATSATTPLLLALPQEERIPLAPIPSNPTCMSSASDLLGCYDTVGIGMSSDLASALVPLSSGGDLLLPASSSPSASASQWYYYNSLYLPSGGPSSYYQAGCCYSPLLAGAGGAGGVGGVGGVGQAGGIGGVGQGQGQGQLGQAGMEPDSLLGVGYPTLYPF